MGLYDRDYVRADHAGPRRHRAHLGSLRLVSFNTWLIVINVAVFVLGAFVLNGPRFVSWVPVEDRFIAGTPTAVVGRATLDGTRTLTIPGLGLPGHPWVDPVARRIVGWQILVPRSVIDAWGQFSTYKAFYGLEVWRFVTFQFLHADWMHLAFNMLGLWMFGGLVEQYLGRKRYAAFYIVCGIFGALMYLLLNVLGTVLVPEVGRIPGLLIDSMYTPLVGASAGIFGVLMALAYIDPHSRVDVLFVIPMKQRTAVYGFALIAAVQLFLGSSNAGGEAAHIGGAIAGFFFIRRMHLLRDFFDVFGDSRGRSRSAGAAPRPAGPPQAEVDRILAKIAAGGTASLSEAERRTLQEATEAKRRG